MSIVYSTVQYSTVIFSNVQYSNNTCHLPYKLLQPLIYNNILFQVCFNSVTPITCASHFDLDRAPVSRDRHINNRAVPIVLFSTRILRSPLWRFHHITSHGENGSRPQRPLYPRNNDRVHFILHKILYYNTIRFPMPWRSAL